VHSPFVFDYLTKCLYKKPIQSKDKTLDILLKSINYFDFSSIEIIGNTAYQEEIKKNFKNLVLDTNKIDLLFFESIKNIKANQLFSEYKLCNKSLIIFNNINQDLTSKSNWLDVIKAKKIAVSIDMYYCGLIFIRKEQQKEHFTIRI
jgi:hypothetical protein